MNRGIAWRQKQDDDQAIADLSEAIRIDPKLFAAYFNLGLARSHKKNFPEAVVDFNEALRIDTQSPEAVLQSNLAQAIVAATEAIRLAPRSAAAYFRRGAAWYQNGDFEQAIADLTEAIELDPCSPRPTSRGAMPGSPGSSTSRR